MDTFRSFIQQYLDGELELYIKSEPIPTDEGPVKVSHVACHVTKPTGHMMPALRWSLEETFMML